jgi:ligand-binding sensor domain-containing protein
MSRFLYPAAILYCSIILPATLIADAVPPKNNSCCIDFDSRYVYVGTAWGFGIYDKEHDRWCDPPYEIAEKKTIADAQTIVSSVLAVLSDSESVWIGHHGFGVYRFDKQSGEMKNWRNEFFTQTDSNKIKCPLPSNTVNTIKTDRRGNIFFATPFGIAKFRDNKWQIFQMETGKLEDNPTSLAIDEASRLWVGASNFYYAYYEERGAPSDERDVGGGIHCFDGKKWMHFYAYNYNLKQEDALHRKTPLLTNAVSCIAADGNLILTGSSLGISVYDSGTDNWRNYTEKNHEMLKGVSSIAVTPYYWWIGSSKGILQYVKGDGTWLVPFKDTLPASVIESVAFDPSDSSLWAVATHRDAYVYRYRDGKLTIYPTRKRITTETPEELFQLGLFLKYRQAMEEARIAFTDFIQKYPSHDKAKQAKQALLDLGEHDERY